MIKFRPLNENDSHLLEKWISSDPEHSKTSDVSFWTSNDRAMCYAVEDEIGVVFYIRAENVLRVHAQFPPNTPEDMDRVRKALPEFVNDMTGVFKPNYRQIIYESVSKPLIKFLQKFGVRSSPNEHILEL